MIRFVFLSAYIGFYSWVSIWALLSARADGDSYFEIAVEVAAFFLALTGLLAYLARVRSRVMISSWRIVAPTIVALYSLMVVFDWGYITTPDPELSAFLNAYILIDSLIIASAILVPALVVNFRFAMARHLPSGSAHH